MTTLNKIQAKKVFKRKLIVYVISIFLLSSLSSYSQQPAFPGAEGYGKFTSGGRGGTIYEVTNLNNSGPGSLREGVSQANRTIVFRVSGNIELESQLVVMGNITIAGQTAPGEGICVRDYPTKIGGDNVIVRYIRFRLGDRYGLKSDAIDINDRTNVILDHCTMSWGVDECFSAYGNQNVSIQWCLIGEGLTLTGHSMGGLWGGYTTYHHNLLHANNTRNPKFAYTYDEDITDYRNNVIYNWGYNSAYTSPTGRVNLVNNYYKAGPASGAGVLRRIVQAEPTKRMYITGNYVAGYPAITADNWNGGVDPLNGGLPIRYDEPFLIPNVLPTQTAEEAYLEVVQHAGASFPKRDDADNRAIKNLLDSTGIIITRQSELGGFPNLFSALAPVDSDHDGMPDDYETGLGLNPNDDSDRNGDLNVDGYTNIENYINGLIDFERQLPRPGFFNAMAVSETTVELEWYDYNSDEIGFIIERSTDSIDYTAIDTTDPDIESFSDISLTPLTTYYYRIRSYNDTANSDYNYSFGTETFADGANPEKAVLVFPGDDQVDLPIRGVKLQWEPGDYTLTFNVYTGTSETTLELQDSASILNSFTIDYLDFEETVFWRIDASNANGTTTGDVWQFTTIAGAVPNLVGYWPFNETGGNVVYDSTDNGNDGTLQNLSDLLRTDGRFGGALDLSNFDTNIYISIPNQPELVFDEDPFSISLWMKLDAITDASTYIIQKGSFNAESGTEQNGNWYGLEIRDGNFRFSVDDNSTKTVVTSSTGSFVTGEWVNVIIVRNVYTKKLWLYKNGVLSSQVNDNTGAVTDELPLLIGNSEFKDTPYFGLIDELVICRHPFSDGEIDSLYKYNAIPTLDPPYIPQNINTVDPSRYDLKVYPNPFSDQVFIEFNNSIQHWVNVEIYDINGRLINSMRKSVIPNAMNCIIWDGTNSNKRNVPDGLYAILLKNTNGIPIDKVMVSKQ